MTNTSSQRYTNSYLLALLGSSQQILQAQDVARISRSALKRLGYPEDVAKVAMFLASNNSSFVVRSEIAVNDGWLLNIV